MAEPLKNSFGAEIPQNLSKEIARVFPHFKAQEFTAAVLEHYEPLPLLARAKKITQTLRQYLPDPYPEALRILMASLGPKLDKTKGFGMDPFFYLPHVYFVADYGLNHFDLSMQAQYELTQRFSAEFSIRAYLEKYPTRTLAYLKKWAQDPNVHVRRLVSEGTRPRLPWAPRLRVFEKDPTPVIELLEMLKDDQEVYVRRSVANHLNDIGKDHPNLLIEIAKRWMQNAGHQRKALLRHALRFAVKQSNQEALKILGFQKNEALSLLKGSLSSQEVRMGHSLSVDLEIKNSSHRHVAVCVDLCVYYVKKSGESHPKIFKVNNASIEAGASLNITKTIQFEPMTTRKHYPGTHRVTLRINGSEHAVGEFELLEDQ